MNLRIACVRWTMVLASASALSTPAAAGPPRVTATVPADGQNNVDPGLARIRFEFDQDMHTDIGWSVCGGGPTFPKFIGNPKWPDPRTFTWDVRLEPGHEYVISINCTSSGRYFRSAQGVHAAMAAVRFKTSGEAGPLRLTPADNVAAMNELRRLIDERYSYRDLRGVQWDQLFAAAKLQLASAQTPHQFAKRAGRMLADAKDLHIWLTVDGTIYGSYRRRARPNFNYRVLSTVVPEWAEPDQCVATGRFTDGTGYILIKKWSRECAGSLDRAYGLINDLKGTAGLIIDVRPNSGGDELLARELAGCFVDAPVVYSKHDTRLGPGAAGFSKVMDRVLEPNRGRPAFRGRVAVLMGPVNMSSCESFLLMMKQVPGCKLVGHQSYGSSGNPKPYNLPNGVTVHLPSWRDMLPDGTLLEGTGVVPDIDVSKSTRELTMPDPVLECGLLSVRE